MGTLNTEHNRACWIDIPVADLDRSVAFYRAILQVDVFKEQFEQVEFAVIAHDEGNGGCLVVAPDLVSESGVLVYLNVNKRIRDAVAQCESHGGKIIQPVHSIGPHGFRAVIQDSEGNRMALHSETDE